MTTQMAGLTDYDCWWMAMTAALERRAEVETWTLGPLVGSNEVVGQSYE